jgi:Rrf2 family cysteine metabolism transcriptional repressor
MMEIPTRGRYSVHILQMMATQPYGRVLTKQEIAEAEGLSPGYVQQLLLMLKAAGFVNSHRGKAGGFSLARPPERMTVAQVLKACEGPIVPSPCVAVACAREPGCRTHLIWMRAAKMLEDLFGRTTIADLAGQDAKDWFLDG